MVVIGGSQTRRQTQRTSVLQDYGTLDDASPHEMGNREDAAEAHLVGPMEHEAGVPSDQQQPEQDDEPQPEQTQQLASQNRLPTGGPKSRLRWTPKLHQLFVEALRALGGPHVATPKQVCPCARPLEVSWHPDSRNKIMQRTQDEIAHIVFSVPVSLAAQREQGMWQQRTAGRGQGQRAPCVGGNGYA